MCGPKKGRCVVPAQVEYLLAASVLGDGLGALADGVLGQFTGKKQTDGGLDFSAGDRGSLVVVSQAGSLGGDSLKDIVDKAVHDGHGFAGDTSVGVHLFQHLVDVDGVGFLPPPPALLVAGPLGLGLRGGFLRSLGCNGFRCGWHICRSVLECRGPEKRVIYIRRYIGLTYFTSYAIESTHASVSIGLEPVLISPAVSRHSRFQSPHKATQQTHSISIASKIKITFIPISSDIY